MNKFVIISISLLIFIIGAGCASAASLDVNDAPLGSALGGGGDNGPFYSASVSSQNLGTIPPQYLADDIRELERPQIADVNSLAADHNSRHPRGVVDSVLGTSHEDPILQVPVIGTSDEDSNVQTPVLGGGLGGGGEERYY